MAHELYVHIKHKTSAMIYVIDSINCIVTVLEKNKTTNNMETSTNTLHLILKKKLEIYSTNAIMGNSIYWRLLWMLQFLTMLIMFVGLSDVPGEAMVKLYCPRCMDVYTPKSSRHHHTDGAYFGTGFPHMVFMVHPEYRPKRPASQFVPRYVCGS